MRIVAGKSYTATPVFSGTMKYLELNPYWNIPHQIAVEEILPKVRTDPGSLAKRGIRVFSSWRNDAAEIDPAASGWKRRSSWRHISCGTTPVGRARRSRKR